MTSSSITTAALSDALPSTVPRLNASGTNWAIFVFHFEDAVEAKGFWNHFDRMVSHPVPADAAVPTRHSSLPQARGLQHPLYQLSSTVNCLIHSLFY